MGLWDSVNSVGIFYDKMFPHTSSTGSIRHIRHAISIDERRGKFRQYPFSDIYYTFAGKYNNLSPNTSQSSIGDDFPDEDCLDDHLRGQGYSSSSRSNASNFRNPLKNKTVSNTCINREYGQKSRSKKADDLDTANDDLRDLHIITTSGGLGTFNTDSTSTSGVSPKSLKRKRTKIRRTSPIFPRVEDDEYIKKEKKRLEEKLKTINVKSIPTEALANVVSESPKNSGFWKPLNETVHISDSNRRNGICRKCARKRGFNAYGSIDGKLSRKSAEEPIIANGDGETLKVFQDYKKSFTDKKKKIVLTHAQLEKLKVFRKIFEGEAVLEDDKYDEILSDEHDLDRVFTDSGFSSLLFNSTTNSSQAGLYSHTTSDSDIETARSAIIISCRYCGAPCQSSAGLAGAPAPPNSTTTDRTKSPQTSPSSLNLTSDVGSAASMTPISLSQTRKKSTSSTCSILSVLREVDGRAGSVSEADDEGEMGSQGCSVGSIFSKEAPEPTLSIEERVAQALDSMLWSPDNADAPSMNKPTVRNVYGRFTNSDIDEYDANSKNDNEARTIACEDVVELWFPGDHSDVGGGWATNTKGALFSDVSLRWLIGEALKAGVIFRPGAVEDYTALHPLLDSLQAPLHDALDCRWKSTIDDDHGRANKSLMSSLFWWLLEVLPIPTYQYNNVKNLWTRTFIPNMGKRRVIPLNAKFHWSVSWKEKYGTVVGGRPNENPGTGGDDNGDGSEPSNPGDLKDGGGPTRKLCKIVLYRPPNLNEGHVRVPLSKNAYEFPPDDIAEAKRFKRAHGSGSAVAAVVRRRIKRKRMQRAQGAQMKNLFKYNESH